MNDVDRWLERTARRRTQPATLYACLLTGRLFRYFGYRLRFPFLIAAVRFAVHVVEFFVVLSSLGGVAAFTVMVLRAGSLLVSGGWWGLLEVMRDRLRAFARLGRREASEYEIGRWLVLAVVAGGLVTVVGGGALLALRPAGQDVVSQLYAFLIIIEVAIGFGVRVLHSGVYATRRVYKPVWSMFVPIAVQLAILGLGFYFYPAAAIVVAIVVSNALGIGITVHFSLEAYRLTGLRPRWNRTVRNVADRLPQIPVRMGLETTLSGLSLRLDAVLVLALIGFYGTDTRTFDLTAGVTSWQNIDAFQFFYLILPLFRGTYESAGIFYFDFVRLRGAPLLRELQLVFFRTLLWLAPVIALFFWALAATLGAGVLHDVPIGFLLALLPMFVLRSFIGIYQIRLFAEGRFGTHLATLGLLVAMLGLVWANPDPAGDLVQITAAMIVQLIVLINVQHLRDRRDPPLPPLIPPQEWLQSLAAQPGPTRVGTLRLPRSITPSQRAAALRLLSEFLSGSGHLAFRSATAMVYYQRCPPGPDDPGRHPDLAGMTGFTAGGGAVLSGPLSGPDAVCQVVARGWVAPPSGDGAAAESLPARFRTCFGGGIAFETGTLRGARDMRALDPGLLAQLLPAVTASLGDGTELVSVQGRWVTPVFRAGTLREIFVLPADPDPGSVRSWRRAIRVHSA